MKRIHLLFIIIFAGLMTFSTFHSSIAQDQPTPIPLFVIPTATPLPTATLSPNQISSSLGSYGLQPNDLPGFIAAPHNGIAAANNLSQQLSTLYPENSVVIGSLVTLYNTYGVVGSSIANYFTPDCQGQVIFGVGTWIRGLVSQTSAEELINDANLSGLYQGIFNWNKFELGDLPGKTYRAPVPSSICPVPSTEYVVEYTVDRLVVAVSVYAPNTTDQNLIEGTLTNLINAVNQRVQPVSIIAQVTTPTEVLATETPAFTPTPEFGYTETFDDNSRGWELYSTDSSAVRLSRGAILLSANQNRRASVPIPNLDSENYYIEAEATLQQESGYIGFRVGDFTDTSQYLLIGRNSSDNWYFRLIQVQVQNNQANSTEMFSTKYADRDSRFLQSGKPVNIGLELRNGLFTVYLNGEQTESVSATFGTTAALAFYSGNCCNEGSVSYDNLVLRPSR